MSHQENLKPAGSMTHRITIKIKWVPMRIIFTSFQVNVRPFRRLNWDFSVTNPSKMRPNLTLSWKNQVLFFQIDRGVILYNINYQDKNWRENRAVHISSKFSISHPCWEENRQGNTPKHKTHVKIIWVAFPCIFHKFWSSPCWTELLIRPFFYFNLMFVSDKPRNLTS